MQLFNILDIMNAYLNTQIKIIKLIRLLLLAHEQINFNLQKVAYNNQFGSRSGAWVVEYSISIQKE